MNSESYKSHLLYSTRYICTEQAPEIFTDDKRIRHITVVINECIYSYLNVVGEHMYTTYKYNTISLGILTPRHGFTSGDILIEVKLLSIKGVWSRKHHAISINIAMCRHIYGKTLLLADYLCIIFIFPAIWHLDEYFFPYLPQVIIVGIIGRRKRF